MDNTENIRVLSLCSGYGGVELALDRVFENPLKVVTVEIESFAVANLVSKAEQSKLAVIANYTDVKTFPSGKFRGCFDIITAGFPCQPFSTAGKRLGGYDPRHLWPHIAEHISAVEPFCVYLENVPGLLSASTLDNRPDLQRHLAELAKTENRLRGKEKWDLSQHRERLSKYYLRQEGVQAYAAIYYSLRDMGYSVEAGLFTAAEVGYPHRRQRLFILAYTESVGHGRGRKNISDRNRLVSVDPGKWDGVRCKAVRLSEDKLANSESRAGQIHTGSRSERTGEVIAGRAGDNVADAEKTDGGAGDKGIESKTTGQRRDRPTDSGKELADDHGDGCCGILRETGQGKDRAQQRTNIDGQGSGNGGEGAPCMADSNSSRCGELCGTEPIRSEHSAIEHGGHWPARPGQQQYEWEEPRTVKSGMGRTVNGFASRVDELRLLGNGVVPACGELAFRSLWKKQCESMKVGT